MALGSLADAYIRLRYDSSSLNSDLSAVKSVITRGLTGVMSVAGGILAATGLQALNEGLMGVARGFIDANAQMEQYRISLGVMLRDQARANRLIMEMEEFARKTPFETGQLIQAAQLLKSYGFEVERLLPMLRSIGDAASASPQGMDQSVMRIALAVGQIRAQGKVMGQEMNQLANAGIPAWEILAEQAGVTIAEVREKTRSGAISGAQAVEMLLKGFDERFGGMMDKQSQSFSGLMSTMRDTAQILLRNIGEPLFQMAKVKLTNLSEWLDTPAASEWAASMRRGVAAVAEFISQGVQFAFSDAGKEAAIFALRVGGVVAALRGLIVITKGIKSVIASVALGSLNIPLMAAASAVAFLGTAFLTFNDDMAPVRQTLTRLVNDLLGLENALSRVTTALRDTQKTGSLIEDLGKVRDSIDERRGTAEREREREQMTPFEREMDQRKGSARSPMEAEIKRLEDIRAQNEKQIEELGPQLDAQAEALAREEVGMFGFVDEEKVAQEQRVLNELEQQLHMREKIREETNRMIADLKEEAAQAEAAAVEGLVRENVDAAMQGLQSLTGLIPESFRNALPKFDAAQPGVAVGQGAGNLMGRIAGFLTGGLAGLGASAGRGKEEREAAIADAAKRLGISTEEMNDIIAKSETLRDREEARRELERRGIDSSLLPDDSDILNPPTPTQTPQFLAIDQMARQIQTSLRPDPAKRVAEDTKKATEKSADLLEKATAFLERIARKVPGVVGFAR